MSSEKSSKSKGQDIFSLFASEQKAYKKLTKKITKISSSLQSQQEMLSAVRQQLQAEGISLDTNEENEDNEEEEKSPHVQQLLQKEHATKAAVAKYEGELNKLRASYSEKREMLHVPEKSEKTVVFIGDRNVGKSTLINAFLGSKYIKQNVVPTLALSYRCARHVEISSNAESLAHIYEIGGGRKLSKLLGIPMSAECLATTQVVLNVDLSEPATCFQSCMWWLERVQSQESVCVNRWMAAGKKDEVAHLRKRSKKRFLRAKVDFLEAREALMETVEQLNAEESDPASAFPKTTAADKTAVANGEFEKLNSFTIVPIVIVLNKYDLFEKNFESEVRKRIIGALRYLAHSNGASIMVCCASSTATREDRNLDQFLGNVRSYLNNFAFGTESAVNGFAKKAKGKARDPSLLRREKGLHPLKSLDKNLTVLTGEDSLEDMPIPRGIDGGREAYLALKHSERIKLWLASIEECGFQVNTSSMDMVPDTTGSDTTGSDFLADDLMNKILQPEAEIDEARYNCQQALETYRWEYERRAKLKRSTDQGESDKFGGSNVGQETKTSSRGSSSGSSRSKSKKKKSKKSSKK